MTEESPLDMLMGRPGFKPLEGEIYDEILEKLRVKIKPSAPIAEEDIIQAVRSLSVLGDPDIAFLYTNQDDHCVKCGNCCRSCNPINFTKWELKAVAEYLHTSYKALKKKIKALPRGDKTLDIPGKPCPFLEGRNHCKIYEIRPEVCKLYPMSIALESRLSHSKYMLFSSVCPAVIDLLATTALMRVVQHTVFRDHPEAFEEMVAIRERIWKPYENVTSEGDRLRLSIDLAQRIRQISRRSTLDSKE